LTNSDKDIIPLFIKDNEGELTIISSYNNEVRAVGENWKLVYLGKPISLENLI
jgi:hypothetical protein